MMIITSTNTTNTYEKEAQRGINCRILSFV